MRLFDLSLRFKLPLWGGGLIVATALALSASFLMQAWDTLERDIQHNAEEIGHTLSHTLFTLLLHDKMWEAFETISAPFQVKPGAAQIESLLVLDVHKRVYVSSHPEDHPVLSPLASLGPDYIALDQEIPMAADADIFVRDSIGIARIYVAVPIANDGVRLGTLIVSYSKSLLWQRFKLILSSSVLTSLLVLAVLLPITAYWGRRMMLPMRLVSERISRIGSGEMQELDPRLYPHKDEVGLLFAAYAQMLAKLREKAAFEREVIESERLAVVGRLAASIAHEINNPLGGMLNSISTLKRHGNPDPVTQKTVSLLERGLSQIRETVAALLVEVKVKSRPLTPADLEDVCTLVAPAANKQGTQVSSLIQLAPSLPLPSTLVRQVLINLLLNAITAAGQGGRVAVRAQSALTQLVMVVENNGQSLSGEQLTQLFEPFTRFSEHGHGLGLWICYRIVTQLSGTIRAESSNGLTRFTVSLPLEPRHDPSATENLPD